MTDIPYIGQKVYIIETYHNYNPTYTPGIVEKISKTGRDIYVNGIKFVNKKGTGAYNNLELNFNIDLIEKLIKRKELNQKIINKLLESPLHNFDIYNFINEDKEFTEEYLKRLEVFIAEMREIISTN